VSEFKGLIPLGIVLLVAVLALNGNGTLAETDWYEDGTHIAQRSGADFISGANVTVTAVDDPTNNRVRYTIAAGAGSTFTTEEGDAAVSAATGTLDFGSGFDLTEAPAGEVNVTLDTTEAPFTTFVPATASALAANGGNCGAGNYPLGVNAAGAAEDCTAVYYQTVQDEAGALTQRGILNFTGAGVACVDNAGATRTDCTIAGGGSTNSFETVTGTAGTNPVADSATDTLALTSVAGTLVITGDQAADSLDWDIADEAVRESHLFAVDAPNDEECLTYEGGIPDSFEWQACASGTAVALDLGDDGADESSGLTEIATVGDTTSIFTMPAANKLLITVSQAWPTAGAFDADPADCGANTFATGIAANGTLTCATPALGTDTSGNYVASVACTGPITGCVAGSEGAAPTIAITQHAGTDVTADLEEEGQVGDTTVTGTAADDQVILGSGAGTATWVSVPNCTDTGGNHLNYTTATNTLSCGTSSSGGPGGGFDPDTNADIFDDFLPNSTSTQSIGSLGWQTAGTGTFAYVNGYMGIVELTTGTSTNDSRYLYLNPPGSSIGYDLKENDFVQVRFKVSQTADTTVFIGFGDSASGSNPNGVVMEYDSSLSANWQLRTRTGFGGVTRTDTTVAANTSYHLFRLTRQASAWQLCVDGANCVTDTTLPTEDMVLYVRVETLTTAAKVGRVDYVWQAVRNGTRDAS